MKLSVLIPAYNQDVRPLVYALHGEAAKLPDSIEILCYDDASTDEASKSLNRELQPLPFLKYVELKANLGRAAIRNKLAQDAQGEYLLFLDGDALVQSGDFIKNYLAAATPNGVVCGGTEYVDHAPSDFRQLLHWKYGRTRERIGPEVRKANPWKSFKTFSFLIPKELFTSIRFDEKLRQYGHEDTVFGMELKSHNIPVAHINNPAIHTGLEKAAIFLRKQRNAVLNLLHLSVSYPVLSQEVKVLKAKALLSRLRVEWLCNFVYKYTRKAIYANLASSHPRLWLLDVYKLGEMLYLARGGQQPPTGAVQPISNGEMVRGGGKESS